MKKKIKIEKPSLHLQYKDKEKKKTSLSEAVFRDTSYLEKRDFERNLSTQILTATKDQHSPRGCRKVARFMPGLEIRVRLGGVTVNLLKE